MTWKEAVHAFRHRLPVNYNGEKYFIAKLENHTKKLVLSKGKSSFRGSKRVGIKEVN